MTGFIIISPQPAHSVRVYARLFGNAAISHHGEDEMSLGAGAARLQIMTPERAMAALGDIPDGPHDQTRMIALSFQVASLPHLEACLHHGGIDYRRSKTQLVIPAASAFHLTLRFSE